MACDAPCDLGWVTLDDICKFVQGTSMRNVNKDIRMWIEWVSH